MRGVVVALACSLRSISRHPPRSAGCGAAVASGRRSPRWLHRDLPRAAPPDPWRSRRGRAGPSYGLPGRAAVPLASGAALSATRQLATTVRCRANLSGRNTGGGGGPARPAAALSFVAQKHAARRLHYDVLARARWRAEKLGGAQETQRRPRRKAASGPCRGPSARIWRVRGGYSARELQGWRLDDLGRPCAPATRSAPPISRTRVPRARPIPRWWPSPRRSSRKSGAFDPSDFHDHYQEALRELVQSKASSPKPPTHPPRAADTKLDPREPGEASQR
jgi:hypothetical protein